MEMMKSSGSSSLPFFEKLLPILTTLGNDADFSCRHWAVCTFDDLIEFCGPDAWKYKDYFGQFLVSSLTDPSVDVRQAACYGIGVAGQFGGPVFQPLLQGKFIGKLSYVCC